MQTLPHCEQPAQKLTSKHAGATVSLNAMQGKALIKGANATYLLETKSDDIDSVNVTALTGDSTASTADHALMPV